MERRLAEIADVVGGRVEGDPERPIRGIAPLERAGPLDLSFLANPRYRRAALRSGAGAILAAPGDRLGERDVIRVENPYLALARALALFAPEAAERRGIDARAVIGEGARIGRDADIRAFAVIGERALLGDRVTIHVGVAVGDGVEIGEDTTLHAHVSVYPGARIGRRVTIHAGSVIGADGFGYALDAGTPVKVPQLGGVVIEDDVEIGAAVCIDRGTLGDTRIRRGARIDNLVQVAHNVEVGENCLLAAQAGISGSTRLGRGVMMAGQSGVVGHVRLGDGAVVLAKSAVTKDVAAGQKVAGIPAVEAGRWRRATAAMARLPEILRRLPSRNGGAGPGGRSRREPADE